MATEEDPHPHRSTLRRPSRLPWIALAVALLAGAFALYRWYASWSRPPPPATATAPAEPAPAAPPAEAPSAAPGPEELKATLERPSQDPLYRRGMSEEEPLRRIAVVADNLAEGTSPREALHFAAPRGKFATVERGGRTYVSDASYARYDAFANAVASVDAKALANAYRGLHAPLESAYRALGYPGASLDRVVARALQRILRAPVQDGPAEVVDEGGVYLFAEPRLERLGAVEKHVLRMGPRNGRLLQAKAREVLAALGLPEEGDPTPAR